MSGKADADELVRYLITSLVDHPEDVHVDVKREGQDTTYEVTMHAEDVGKVIGRQGRVIKAIRTLVRSAGQVDGARVDVEIMG
jgi:predicted RNA-binding protein YlqC (UPF0109 family)